MLSQKSSASHSDMQYYQQQSVIFPFWFHNKLFCEELKEEENCHFHNWKDLHLYMSAKEDAVNPVLRTYCLWRSRSCMLHNFFAIFHKKPCRVLRPTDRLSPFPPAQRINWREKLSSSSRIQHHWLSYWHTQVWKDRTECNITDHQEEAINCMWQLLKQKSILQIFILKMAEVKKKKK